MSMRARRIGLGVALAGAVALSLSTLGSEAEETTLQDKAAIGLSEVGNAERTLTTAIVKDRTGAAIGPVHGITRGADGRIKTVQVALGEPSHVVALDARNMTYLRKPNVILAVVTREEAQALPRLGQ